MPECAEEKEILLALEGSSAEYKLFQEGSRALPLKSWEKKRHERSTSLVEVETGGLG